MLGMIFEKVLLQSHLGFLICCQKTIGALFIVHLAISDIFIIINTL